LKLAASASRVRPRPVHFEALEDRRLLTIYFEDMDHDTFGNPNSTVNDPSPTPPPGFVSISGDCNDTAANVNPSAFEVVGDGVDENCDGQEIVFKDADEDGFRTNSTQVSFDADADDPGEAYASEPSGDCDDTKATVHPGAFEVVGDLIDEDCNSQEIVYQDIDEDGFRTDLTLVSNDLDADDPGEAPASLPAADCNDNNAGIHPGAVEIADGIDQNCDGVIDEGTNQAPTVAVPIADTMLSNGSAAVTIDLTTVFNDAEDGTNLTFAVADNDSPSVIDAQISNGKNLVLTLGGSLGSANLTIRAADSGNLSIDDVFTVTVFNNPPVASINGPAQGVPGQLLSYTVSATDDSAADTSVGFTFFVNWGDNSAVSMASGQTATLTHTYGANGTFSVSVTATDTHGDGSSPKTKDVTVNPVVFQQGVLTVGGTSAGDIISIRPIEKTGKRVALSVAGSVVGNFLPSKILVYGNGGADSVTIASAKIAGVTIRTNVSARIFGGPGNDNLSVAGSGAANLVSGDQGNDTLLGSAKRDVLIGGLGADSIRGGAGDDILVAGVPSHTQAELEQLLNTWAGTGTYSARVAALAKTTGSGPHLNKFNVTDDTAVDTLLGDAGADWFLASTVANQIKKDKVTRTAGEVLTQLPPIV
jgi:hypothetical protein